MSSSYTTVVYENKHVCVSWCGQLFSDGDEFNLFLKSEVRSRLDDVEETEQFESHLSGLTLTGMGKESLEAVLAAEVPEERKWAAGEALAEAYLTQVKNVVFPWNTERDKRNPSGSLPGADLVGFVVEDSDCRLALGEVKVSSENAHPPQIMSGRSGHMGHQLDNLARNLTIIWQLIKWLHGRVKNSTHEAAFESACANYFNSGLKHVSLFGVLIRDTAPNERDLSVLGKALRHKLTQPTECDLIALYLPWKASGLISFIRQGGDK